MNSCLQSNGPSRVSPHTLRLAPATPWCDWRSSFIVIRNERVCWENCRWWLRRMISNTLKVSNKQMKRTLQIITNVLACLKCMLWLPAIVFFLCSCTSPSFYFSVLPHSFHIPPTYSFFPSKSTACVQACVFMRLLVCVCMCLYVLCVDFFSSSPTVAPYCLFLSRLWAAAHPLAAARFKKSITADQEAEVRAFRPGAQELTVGREWDFYAYCNPSGFPEPSTGRTAASHVKFTGLNCFFLRWQCECHWTQRGACKMCIPPPSTFQYCHVADDQGSEWITKREREGMFEVFHIDLIRQHNCKLKPHVSLLEYVTSILCFSLNIPSRGSA